MSGQINEALVELNARLVLADAIGEALDLAAGDQPAPWVHVYRLQVESIREASEALEELVYGLLRGDGGCGPHGGREQASSDLLRGPGGALPGSRSCPEKPSSLASE
jgi:hypothetical protein